MLTAEAEAEIAELAQRFGVPRRWRRVFEISSPQNEAWVRKMLKRRGEVVLVVPLDEQRVWLHTKRFYPANVYRLPSGGIHKGERIQTAARREAYEEMGFVPEFARFMGVVENVFALKGESADYPTFILETKPMPGSPRVTDPNEAISGFRLIQVQDLPEIAQRLNSLTEDWQPWGRFRATPHALLAEALTKDKC